MNELSHAVIGGAIEVHRALGPGFLESAYEQALVIELVERQIPFNRQVALDVAYKGKIVGCGRVDLIVARRVLIELKAADTLTDVHAAQLMSYLKASNCELGLLLNFNVRSLRQGIRRLILNSSNRRLEK